MSKEEGFFEKIGNKQYFEAFMLAIKNTVELEIITLVEEVGDSSGGLDLVNKLNESGDQAQTVKYKGNQGNRIYTKINLIDGDITNIIGSEFLKDEEKKSLMDFHREQVEKGREIIKANLESLKAMIDYFKNLPSEPEESPD